MRVRRVPFSVLLPLAELATWSALLFAPTALMVVRFYRAAHGAAAVSFHAGQFQETIPRHEWIPFAFESASSRISHEVMSANLPGMFIEILISLPTSWPNTWCPNGLSLDSWRALSLPFFCLPAWWFVGKGLDGLLSRRRLHWTLLLTGSALCVLFIVVLFGMRFGVPPEDHVEAWIYCGLGFWIIAFGVLPIAWVQQWRRKSIAETEPQQLEAASQPRASIIDTPPSAD